MNRRELLLASVSAAAGLSLSGAARAQAAEEVTIGVIYPMSGASAQVGIDARHAFETALDIVNNDHQLDLISAKGAGLTALGDAKIRLVFADHQADPSPLGVRRDEAQRGLALEHRRLRRAAAADLEEVVHDPDRVEAGVVGRARDAREG